MEEGGEFTFPTATPEPRTSPRRAAAPSLGDVPDNILVRVSAFLRCRTDRVHMACVNKLWSRAVRGVGRPPPPVLPPLPALPPQLPWLIFPNTETPTFYSPITRRYHRLCRLPPDVRRARFCGSAVGGWLVLALDSCHGYALYNLNSGQRIPLPASFTTPGDKDVPLVVHAATFSAPPSGPNQYMVAAIVLIANRSTAAFWSEGSESWFSPSTGALLEATAQDVIYYGDAFFFVTSREDVVSFQPVFLGWNNNVGLTRVDYDMQQRGDLDDDIGVHEGMGVGVMRRYLVESRGRLLMVVRYFYNQSGSTEQIRVFQFQVMPPEAAADDQRPRAAWENLGNQLDGRMLFLGRGCSRSLEVADYNGIQGEFEESMIYFIDERMASERLPGGRSLYSFTDMGRYDMEEIATAPWPEGLYPSTSDNAPPTWWLH
uniref:KIB1-4 beta-propeller domain-containing protein n=1 Tax=Setaria italica TaxID=4555 RepID=K3XPM0_SETIT